MSERSLRVFVAMPGTSLGPHAQWSDIPRIERFFYGRIQDLLSQRLERPVELQIEKKKVSQGVIHKSMFAEAFDADVYIADLTGANPNVYLELGVRWAVADSVTVLVSQSPEDVRFNVASNRYIPYSGEFEALEVAINQVCDAVVQGLASGTVDSPVRDAVSLVLVERREYDALLVDLASLREIRGHDLLAAARSAATNDLALELLERAVAVNPLSYEICFELGRALRLANRLEEAEVRLQSTISLRPESGDAWRELGITQSNVGRASNAVDSLRRAVDLDPADALGWSGLGGAYRRLALERGAPDRAVLELGLSAYERASSLNENDTYPLLNAARVRLLLARAGSGDDAVAAFADAFHLCMHKSAVARRKMLPDGSAALRREAAWSTFDLAEAMLFGADPRWEATLREAIQLVDQDQRDGVLATVLGPFEEYLRLGVLGPGLRPPVERAISLLTDALPR
jgi:tetratricopeptide (TPR) repeat protein